MHHTHRWFDQVYRSEKPCSSRWVPSITGIRYSVVSFPIFHPPTGTCVTEYRWMRGDRCPHPGEVEWYLYWKHFRIHGTATLIMTIGLFLTYTNFITDLFRHCGLIVRGKYAIPKFIYRNECTFQTLYIRQTVISYIEKSIQNIFGLNRNLNIHLPMQFTFQNSCRVPSYSRQAAQYWHHEYNLNSRG